MYKKLIKSILILSVVLIPASVDAGSINKPPNNLGLVGYWSMDEGSGTNVTDLSGQGNTGTTQNMEEADWINGKRGKALDLDGSNEYIDTGSDSSTDLDTFTISAWVKLDDDGSSDYGIVSRGGNNTWPYVFSVNDNSNNYRLALYRGAWAYGSTGAISNDTWHHVVVSRNASGGAVTFYVDGQSAGSGSLATDINDADDPLLIGDWTGGASENFSGNIDEVRIYNRVLSASEVADLYESGATKLGAAHRNALTDGLVGYWTFDGRDMVSNVADISGNNNDGNLEGQTSTTTIKGRLGQALDFDGSDDYVRAVDTGSFPDAPPITLSAWVYSHSDASDAAGIIGIYNSSQSIQWFNLIQDDDIIYVSPRNHGNWSLGAPSATITTNEWHHIVGVFEADDSRLLYIDGVLADTDTNSRTVTMADIRATIGQNDDSSPNGNWDGVIDDARIYNRALSAQEIEQLYNLGTPDIFNTSHVGTGDPLDDNLVGHWTFDGPRLVNNVEDSSGNGNHGTISGQTATSTVKGKIGQALDFDGGNDYVDLGDHLFVNGSGAEPYSTFAWIKPDGSAANDSIVSQYYFSSSLRFTFRLEDCELSYWKVTERATSGVNICDGDWHHVGFTKDSVGNVQIYLNGSPSGSSGTDTDTFTTTVNNTLIGAILGSGGTPDSEFDGSIDDVRIYNKALTQFEVERLYNAGK